MAAEGKRGELLRNVVQNGGDETSPEEEITVTGGGGDDYVVKGLDNLSDKPGEKARQAVFKSNLVVGKSSLASSGCLEEEKK